MPLVAHRRPWIPTRPVRPSRGYVAHANSFDVPGIATVVAAPYRSRADALAFAVRIARDPAEYLDVLAKYHVPGMIDRRPTSHARGGTPFPRLASGREGK